MIKKLLGSTLLITGLLLGSFSYGVDSYTCDYQGIVESVADEYGNSTVYTFTDCNDLGGGYYQCSSNIDISTSNGKCYQFGGFDIYNFVDLNITIDNGNSYINFASYNNNIEKINGYMICNPNRLMVQGNIRASYSNPTFTVSEFSEDDLTNYSYTYTCPTCQECPSCPLVNTGEILSGYILESEITTGYCETRFNMIEPSDCPSSGTGDIMRSSFWVNNRQVLGGRNIFLYLPDFLNWDYTYIDKDLEINVENEGDYKYMQGVIDNQTTTPNETDLNNIITGIIPLFVPGLIIILFIYFVFRFIKKIF